MAKKKAAPTKKAAATKPAPKAAKPLASMKTTPEIRGLRLAVRNMMIASQDSKLAILQVLRDAKKPMTVQEIHDGLETIDVELETDSIEIHLIFLSDPAINLVKIVSTKEPMQYEAV